MLGGNTEAEGGAPHHSMGLGRLPMVHRVVHVAAMAATMGIPGSLTLDDSVWARGSAWCGGSWPLRRSL